MTRQDVYTLIDGERAFQDKTWPAASLPPLSPTGTLRLIEVLKTQADSLWHETPDAVLNGQRVNNDDLTALVHIAAVAVRCLEAFGAPPQRT